MAGKNEVEARNADLTPPPLGSPRVLLLASDLEWRGELERLLGARWVVDPVTDPETAIGFAGERPPGLFVLDERVEGMEAVEIVRRLREQPRTACTPIMVVAGGAEVPVEVIEAGADDCMPRPVAPRELVARVGTHIALWRSREEAGRRERMARHEAEGANRAKDEFIAMVSHELRSPLAAILIWTQLLRSERVEPGVERSLAMIDRSARTLTRIIDDLLDVSRIITGKLSLTPHPLDIAAVVDAAVSSARTAAEAKSVELEAAVDHTLPAVLGDPGRLQQVVGNLISNAIKFTEEGGRVSVRLDALSGHARVSVRDNGVGIDEEFLPYIFERFRQADSTSTRTEKGLGLGLSIARHLVELHGGTIEAESAGAGCGSTFTVTLPLLPADSGAFRPEPLRAPSDRELAGVRILVVDDDEDAREALAMLLSQWGAEIHPAASVREALAVLGNVRPDVLLSDIAMPGEDGYALIQKVRQRPKDEGGEVPAAALTAYATSEDRSRALAAGFHDHLAKPVEPDELLSVMASLAGRRPRPAS